jgi:DNA sulfur modification protein DndB
MIQAKRLPKIRKFLARTTAVLPTNIILQLSEKVTVDKIDVDLDELREEHGKHVAVSSPHCDLVRLNIPMEYASLELIDGQHRLFAFTETEPATIKSFNLVVLGIRGLLEKQQQDTFLAINDTSKRVDPNLVAYLKYTTDDIKCQEEPELMAIRVVVDLTEHAPFKGLIRLLDTGKNIITLKGFSGYDLKGLLSKKCSLRIQYSENRPDQYVTALRMYFSAIKETFPDEWSDPHTYVIATNRGISAFLKLLRSILDLHGAPLSHADAKKYLAPLKKRWGDWRTANLKNKYVGSAGWKQFHRELVEVIEKDFPGLEA